jgi:hypothetical protein
MKVVTKRDAEIVFAMWKSKMSELKNSLFDINLS